MRHASVRSWLTWLTPSGKEDRGEALCRPRMPKLAIESTSRGKAWSSKRASWYRPDLRLSTTPQHDIRITHFWNICLRHVISSLMYFSQNWQDFPKNSRGLTSRSPRTLLTKKPISESRSPEMAKNEGSRDLKSVKYYHILSFITNKRFLAYSIPKPAIDSSLFSLHMSIPRQAFQVNGGWPPGQPVSTVSNVPRAMHPVKALSFPRVPWYMWYLLNTSKYIFVAQLHKSNLRPGQNNFFHTRTLPLVQFFHSVVQN